MKKPLYRRPLFWVFAALTLMAALFAATTRINFKKHFRGLYLIKGTGRYLFEVKNDLFLGEGEASGRLIWGVNIEDPRYRLSMRHMAGTYLDCIWDPDNGSGSVRSYLTGGREMLAIFSRFVDEEQRPTHGLFVGGGLPQSNESPDDLQRNDTGVAYFDGGKWYHAWCNANEAIIPASGKALPPSRWKYLGSKVGRVGDSAIHTFLLISKVPL